MSNDDLKNPFNPIPPLKQSKNILGVLTFLVRLPFAVIFFLELWVFNQFIYPFICFNSARRIVQLLNNIFFGRLLLLTLGFFRYSSPFHFFQKLTKTRAMPQMRSGYLLLSNRVSPIDILAFTTYFSPVFTRLVFVEQVFAGQEKNEYQAYLQRMSIVQALLQSFNLRNAAPIILKEIRPEYNLKKISQMCNESLNKKHGPVLVFFEGGITNGLFYLQPDRCIEEEIKVFMKDVNYRRDPVYFQMIYEDDNVKLIGKKSAFQSIYAIMSRWSNTFWMEFKKQTKDENFCDLYSQFDQSQYVGLTKSEYNWTQYEQWLAKC